QRAPLFLQGDRALTPLGALLPRADLPRLLAGLLAARMDAPPRGPPRLRRPGQLAPLPRRAPRRQVRGVQPLPPQQRPDRARRLTAVGLSDNLPLVLHREPPPRRLGHHLDRRPT